MPARDQLVQSPQDLLWERRYVGTNPKAIQRRAKAGQGSMYHHFAGKADLVPRIGEPQCCAEQLRAAADAAFRQGRTAGEQVSSYLLRERDVLRGCPIGRLALDPDIIASPALRAPPEQTFNWLRGRPADVLTEGKRKAELSADLDPADTAAALVAVLQGG